jgi:hypothetical protein
VEQILTDDKPHPSRLSISPDTTAAAKTDETDDPSRTKWLRGGRQPAIVVTNEAGELVYTVHRAIHRDPVFKEARRPRV